MHSRRFESRRRLANAIDPASGFKVPLENLVRQWDGEMVDYRFVDRRNPQDFVRGIPEAPLPYARPETEDTFIFGPILTETSNFILLETGDLMVTQGTEIVL